MSDDAPSARRPLRAGLALATGTVARLAFWAAVAYPAVYAAVHVEYGLGSLAPHVLAGVVAANALVVVVGHRHAAGGSDATGARSDVESPSPPNEADPTTTDDAPGVAPVGGD